MGATASLAKMPATDRAIQQEGLGAQEEGEGQEEAGQAEGNRQEEEDSSEVE